MFGIMKRLVEECIYDKSHFVVGNPYRIKYKKRLDKMYLKSNQQWDLDKLKFEYKNEYGLLDSISEDKLVFTLLNNKNKQIHISEFIKDDDSHDKEGYIIEPLINDLDLDYYINSNSFGIERSVAERNIFNKQCFTIEHPYKIIERDLQYDIQYGDKMFVDDTYYFLLKSVEEEKLTFSDVNGNNIIIEARLMLENKDDVKGGYIIEPLI